LFLKSTEKYDLYEKEVEKYGIPSEMNEKKVD
jgi:hypothetical protein